MWKEQAEALFFIEHLQINEIVKIAAISRQAISKHLNGCDGYGDELIFRKNRNAAKRKEYQRQWDRENRSRRHTEVDGESLRREHDLAAIILSKEMRYGK